MELKSLMNWQ